MCSTNVSCDCKHERNPIVHNSGSRHRYVMDINAYAASQWMAQERTVKPFYISFKKRTTTPLAGCAICRRRNRQCRKMIKCQNNEATTPDFHNTTDGLCYPHLEWDNEQNYCTMWFKSLTLMLGEEYICWRCQQSDLLVCPEKNQTSSWEAICTMALNGELYKSY